MAKLIQSIRGMNDIFPDAIAYWQHIESVLRQVVATYGYRELRAPIAENTALFARSIGEATDIVEKEMYTFTDRSGESVSLRPEGTASCIRACLQHDLLRQTNQRIWYYGPMFRYERPQKGRYRQFYQFGVEALNIAGAQIDAELIMMSARMWRELGLTDQIHLQLNSLGDLDERRDYRDKLVNYFTTHQAMLDADHLRRLQTNPLRLLDSKDEKLQPIIKQAPKLLDYLGVKSREHFTKLCHYLDQGGVRYEINPALVRGLDYYTDTVFEWVSPHLGAQATVCAGGRYDGLVEQLGGRSTPAVGFALGMERLVALYEREQALPKPLMELQCYLIMVGDQAAQVGYLLAEDLRNAIPTLRILTHCGGGSFKSQFKKADRSGALTALILGEDEIATNTVSVKFLRVEHKQETVSRVDLVNYLEKNLSLGAKGHGSLL